MDKGKQKSAPRSIWEEKTTSLLVFLLVFSVTVGTLSAAGLLPENKTKGEKKVVSQAIASENVADPTRIVIESIGVDVEIKNPQSRDIKVLDEALKEGAVRYPGSGKLGESKNVFLFGHSSSLPIVRNSNFKAFNKLDELRAGDMIRVAGGGKEHLYRVYSLKLVEADSALVDLSGSDAKLTLSTCNSFGDPGERFVVEAEFVGSYVL
ncbi:MAG: sortase [Candidatus Paceibacterota bacterium]